jgi:hypothetical protein
VFEPVEHLSQPCRKIGINRPTGLLPTLANLLPTSCLSMLRAVQRIGHPNAGVGDCGK